MLWKGEAGDIANFSKWHYDDKTGKQEREREKEREGGREGDSRYVNSITVLDVTFAFNGVAKKKQTSNGCPPACTP